MLSGKKKQERFHGLASKQNDSLGITIANRQEANKKKNMKINPFLHSQLNVNKRGKMIIIEKIFSLISGSRKLSSHRWNNDIISLSQQIQSQQKRD